MSTRTPRRDEASRAEARRRARLAAQGRLETDVLDDEPPPTPPQRPSAGFLERILPAAPALPNRPDPLAGFEHRGSARAHGLRSGLWLLRRRFVIWIPAGILFGLSYLLSNLYQGTVLNLIATGISFAALIGAGWFGWERPWLFGLAASVVGYALYLGGVVYLLGTGGGAGSLKLLATASFALYVITTGFFQLVLGLFGGFYGGYIRRRLAAQRRAQPARRSTRGR